MPTFAIRGGSSPGSGSGETIPTLNIITAGPFNASPFDRVRYNPTSGTFTINMPAAPARDTQVAVKNVTSDLTLITVSGNGINIEDPTTSSFAASTTVVGDGISIVWEFDGTNWVVVATAAAAADPFGALTEGSVAFVGAGGVAAEDNTNFFWDDTNNRLGIGTATPADSLEITGAMRISALTSFAVGAGPRIHRFSVAGLALQAGSGSVADFALFTNAGQRLLDIIAGTNNLFLQPTSAGTVRVGSTLRVDEGLSAFGATPPAGQPAAIANAAGGATVDAEARTAINALLAVMRANGLIDT